MIDENNLWVMLGSVGFRMENGSQYPAMKAFGAHLRKVAEIYERVYRDDISEYEPTPEDIAEINALIGQKNNSTYGVMLKGEIDQMINTLKRTRDVLQEMES